MLSNGFFNEKHSVSAFTFGLLITPSVGVVFCFHFNRIFSFNGIDNKSELVGFLATINYGSY